MKKWRESQHEVKKQNIAAVHSLQTQVEALTLGLWEISQPVADAIQLVKAAKSILKNLLKTPPRFNQQYDNGGEKKGPGQ